jgi:ABC-type lipoprotein release transport system permease subunit
MSKSWQNASTVLAWRNLWRYKRRTIITLASISFGLTLAMIFLTLGNGAYQTLIDQGARLYGGHFSVEHPNYLESPSVDLRININETLRTKLNNHPNIKTTKALVMGQGIAKSGRGASSVQLMGVEPEREKTFSPIAESIIKGSYLAAQDKNKIVIGVKLAQELRVKVGKKLVLSTNDVEGNLVESLFRVKGIFSLGSPEMDGSLVQIPIKTARQFFAMKSDEVSQLGIIAETSKDLEQEIAFAHTLFANQSIAIRFWDEVLTSLAAFIRVDKASNLIFNAIICFLGLFTIWNTILMSVLERKREFAVMLALGTSPRLIQIQVIGEAFYLGLLGVLIGLTLGGLSCWALQVQGIPIPLDESTTVGGFPFPTHLYGRLWPEAYAAFASTVFGATVLMSLFASRHVNQIPVANVLR